MDATHLVLAAFSLALIARPIIAIPILCLLIEQETSSGSLAGADPLVSFGQLIYVRTDASLGLRYIAILALAVGAVAFLRITDQRVRMLALGAALACALCGVDLVLLGYGADQLVAAQTLFILWGSICVGLWASCREGWQDGFRGALYVAAAVKAAVAVVALASGHVVLADGGYSVVYYDSATLLIASAVFGVALADRRSPRWLVVLALVASAALAVTALRRTSLVGAAAALVVIALFGRNRRVKVTGGLGLVILVVVVNSYLPQLFTAFVGGVSEAASGVFGGGGDQSTAGHVSDISVGYQHALNHRLLGVGPLSPQLPGLVAPSTVVYVHNEFLQAWLMFGAFGLVAIVGLIAASVVLSWLAIRRGLLESEPAVVFSAIFLFALIPGYWFFPHILTLPRFTLLFGWCLGLLAGTVVQRRSAPRGAIGSLVGRHGTE